MKRYVLAAVAAIAFATATPAMAESVTVNFDFGGNMQSLRDTAQQDKFAVSISDLQIVTKLNLVCKAGTTKWMGFSRSDEACAVAGAGAVVNPKDSKQLLPRTQYLGGFTVTKSGFTDAEPMKVNYLALGNVSASSGQFGGNLMMKPENPSPTAAAIGKKFLEKIKGTDAGQLIDDRIDTVAFERFYIPSAGRPEDKGCYWSGDMVYAYQTSSWMMKLKASCEDKAGTKEYQLTGNMPWTDLDEEGNAEYTLNLALPSAAAASDDALFVDAGDDLFAAADGIAGTIKIKQSSFVSVKVDGADEKLASQVEASGALTGTNVPLPVVRSFATMMGVLSRTFFGA